jgi:ATP-binding cassette, subfamily B, bacterial
MYLSNSFVAWLKCLRQVSKVNGLLTVSLLVLIVLQAVCPVLMAIIVQKLIDTLTKAEIQHSSDIIIYIVLEGILALIIVSSQHASTHIRSILMLEFNQSIRHKLIVDVLNRPLIEREHSGFQDRFDRIWREASQKPLAMALKGFGLIQSIVLGVGSFVLLGGISPIFAFGVIIGAIPRFIADYKFSEHYFGFYNWAESRVRHQAYIEHLISDERYSMEIRTLGLQKRLSERHYRLHKDLLVPQKKLAFKQTIYGIFFRVISIFINYGLASLLVLQAFHHKISIGELVMGLALLKEGNTAVTRVFDSAIGIMDDFRYVNLLEKHLEESQSNHNELPVKAKTKKLLKKGLELRNISFTYPGAASPALQNISFTLKPGQTKAIVGVNGSGKSTLVKTICGLYSIKEGNICLFGKELTHWHTEDLLKQISVILQSFIHYQWSMKENIVIGDVDRPIEYEHMDNVLKVSQSKSVEQSLSLGLETQLGKWFEGGVELSGGEWQRIALARMFYRKDASLLILDEPSSALDINAELELHESLRHNNDNKMILVISHNFATVRHANEILVLDKGIIIERGSHEELMQIKGKYYKMYQGQIKSISGER